MRWNILFLLAVGGSILVNNTAEASSRTRSAYCMQGPTSPGLSNCTFTSMAQCRATASGRRMTCIANPFYKGRRSSVPLPGDHFQTGNNPPAQSSGGSWEA